MNDELELKQERSIPVQGRIDITELADLVIYFESLGIVVNSMSMLLNVCVELARKIAFDNEKLTTIHNSIQAAHETLGMRGLYQPGMMKRGGNKKIMRGRQFENLRSEGDNPKQYIPQEFNQVHNRQSIVPPNVSEVLDREENQRLVETYKKLNKEGKLDPIQSESAEYNLYGEVSDKGKDDSRIMPTIEEVKAKQEGEETNSTLDEVNELFETIANKDNTQPRQKTNEEIKADEERIADKDKALAEMDMSGPRS